MLRFSIAQVTWSLRDLLAWPRSLRRHPILVLGCLVLAGWGVYGAGWLIWVEYHYRAAKQALEGRNFAQARAHLALCLRARPSSLPIQVLAARAARCAGDMDDAERHLDVCQELHGNSEALELEQALWRAQEGQVAEVRNYLTSCLARADADRPWILEALAQGYIKAYYLPEALHCLDQLLECRPNHVQALIWRGRLQERLERAQEALVDYRSALELDPEEDEIRLLLAESLVQMAQAKEALSHFEFLSERQPGHPGVLLGLARCHRDLGEVDQARLILDALLKAHPQTVQALVMRGKLEAEAGQTAWAQKWLRPAAFLAPYDLEANYCMAQCLEQEGNRQEAAAYRAQGERVKADQQLLDSLTWKIFQGTSGPSTRTQAGILSFRLGREQEGLRWLAGALQEAPNDLEAHQALADYHQRAGNPSLAARHRGLARGQPQGRLKPP